MGTKKQWLGEDEWWAKRLLNDVEKMTRTTYNQKSAQRHHMDKMGDTIRAVQRILGFRKGE